MQAPCGMSKKGGRAMAVCTSITKANPSLSLGHRVRGALGVACIVAAIASSGAAWKVEHAQSHWRLPFPVAQVAVQRDAGDDDYVQLLASVVELPTPAAGD
jgi:hypothetical protein